MDIAALIFDGVVVLIVVGLVFSGYTKGFFGSLVNTAGYILASIGAYIGSRALAITVYDLFIRESMVRTIEKAINEGLVEADFTSLVSTGLKSLPSMLRNMVYNFFGGMDAMFAQFDQGTAEAGRALAVTIADEIVYPVLFALMQSIFFLLLFTALIVIVRAIAKSVRFIRKLPLIGAADSILGCAFGLVNAAFVLFIIVLAVRFLMMLSGNKIPYFNEDTIANTYLFRFLYDINPLLGKLT